MARRLPWRSAVRRDRKAILTVLGVALGVVFSVVGLAVPAGLRSEVLSAQSTFRQQDFVISLPDAKPFDATTLGLPDATSILLFDDHEFHIVTAVGPKAPAIDAGIARPGAGLVLGATVELGNATLHVGQVVTSAILAKDQVLVAPEDAARARPDLAGRATYVLAPHLTSDQSARLRLQGFDVASAPAIDPFFAASATEIAFDLILIVVFSGILVVVFVYEFMRSDVRERRREIGLWRALGMRANDVLALVLARSLAIGIAGLGVGAAVGLLGLALAGLVTHSGVFGLRIPPLQWLEIVGAFLGASLLGGLMPAWRAARGSVRDQMEAAT